MWLILLQRLASSWKSSTCLLLLLLLLPGHGLFVRHFELVFGVVLGFHTKSMLALLTLHCACHQGSNENRTRFGAIAPHSPPFHRRQRLKRAEARALIHKIKRRGTLRPLQVPRLKAALECLERHHSKPRHTFPQKICRALKMPWKNGWRKGDYQEPAPACQEQRGLPSNRCQEPPQYRAPPASGGRMAHGALAN